MVLVALGTPNKSALLDVLKKTLVFIFDKRHFKNSESINQNSFKFQKWPSTFYEKLEEKSSFEAFWIKLWKQK